MQIQEIMIPGITGFSKYPDMFKDQDNKVFEMYLYQVVTSYKGKVVSKEMLVNNKSGIRRHSLEGNCA